SPAPPPKVKRLWPRAHRLLSFDRRKASPASGAGQSSLGACRSRRGVALAPAAPRPAAISLSPAWLLEIGAPIVERGWRPARLFHYHSPVGINARLPGIQARPA